ncbi:MAG: hypothetical protein M1357_02745 [Candidatus Marsarchaeota archaeon]|nr:hypothetical protein [Candidatus Marsarchaeota archaeon]
MVSELTSWSIENGAVVNKFINKVGVVDHIHVAKDRGDGVIEISLAKKTGKLEVTISVHENRRGDWAVREMSSIREILLKKYGGQML